MKKKLNKIAALVLALVMVITGFVAVPQMDVQAANDVPSIITKTDVTNMKPGDKVHVECWLKPNGNVMQVVGGFDFDTKVYTYVKDSLEQDPNNVLKKNLMFIVDEEDVYTAGGFSVLLEMKEGNPVNKDVLLFTFDVTVNENAKGSGLMGFNCVGIQTGTNDNDRTDIDGKDVPLTTLDKNGNKIENGEIPVAIELSSLKINKEDFTMTKGTSETLTVTGTPAEALEGQTITWKSSNKDVVTVDSKGKVEAVGVGNATITATAAGKSDSVKITVNNPLKKITVDPATLTLKKGTSKTLSVKYDPADTTDEKAVTWKSENESVATVDENGVVTAVAGGKTKVIATAKANNKITAVCEVKVPIHTESIALNKTEITDLLKGKTEKLEVSFIPSNTEDSREVKWTSSAADIAAVDANGTVKALKEGTATITATTADGKHTASCTVTVKEIHLTDVKLDEMKNPSELFKGEKHQIKIGLNPIDTTDNVIYTFASSDEKVVSVDKNGMVTALKNGKATITITVKTTNTDFEKTLTYDITVEEIPLESIEIKGDVTSLEEGKTTKLNVVFNPTNTTDDKTVVWSSSDTKVATVDANGVVKAVKAGNVKITAKVGDKTAEYALKVTAKANGTNNKNEKPADGGAVKTGDSNHISGFVVAMLLSIAAIVGVVIFKKRTHR